MTTSNQRDNHCHFIEKGDGDELSNGRIGTGHHWGVRRVGPTLLWRGRQEAARGESGGGEADEGACMWQRKKREGRGRREGRKERRENSSICFNDGGFKRKEFVWGLGGSGSREKTTIRLFETRWLLFHHVLPSAHPCLVYYGTSMHQSINAQMYSLIIVFEN